LFRHEGYSFGVNQESLSGIVSTWPQPIYMKKAAADLV